MRQIGFVCSALVIFLAGCDEARIPATLADDAAMAVADAEVPEADLDASSAGRDRRCRQQRRTQPSPRDHAWCDNTGELFSMPLHLRVTADRSLP